MKQYLIINRLYSVFCHLSSVVCPPPSTSVEDPLQINPFYAKQTQFPKKSNDVSFFYTMDYENKSDRTLGENKPNSNPIKPNLRKAKMNVNSLITKGYRKNDDFVVRINKPNFRNGQNERKLTYSKGLQKKRCFRSPKNKPNSNPNKPKSRTLFPLTARPVRRNMLSSNGARDYNGIFSQMSFLYRTPIERSWK